MSAGYRKIQSIEKWGAAEKQAFTVGQDNVKEIGEHMPMGPGDPCFYDVVFNDGAIVRLFYPDVVRISKLMTLEVPKQGIIQP